MSNDPNEMISLMNQMGVNNPKAQLLAQMLNQQNATADESQESEIRINKLIQQIKKQAVLIKQLGASNKRLKAKIKLLVENLNYRLEINDALAAATGSCPECWGENISCKNCSGQGSPGKMEIDEEAFMNFIQPVIQQFAGPANDSQLNNGKNNLHNSLN